MIGSLDSRYREATVIGAGISGLIAANALKNNGYKVKLLERSNRTGGLIRTEQTEYGISESSAHSIRATRTVLDWLSDLEIPFVKLQKQGRTKFISRDGNLRRFPFSVPEAFGLGLRIFFYSSEKKSTA